MSSSRFDDILQQVRSDLTPDEQAKLIQALSRHTTAANGEKRGISLYDALNDRGIIGSITDAPPDLGTNPKYMEGFGQHG